MLILATTTFLFWKRPIRICNQCLLALIAWAVWQTAALFFHPSQQESQASTVAAQENAVTANTVTSPIKPLSEYENAIAGRDIFHPAWLPSEPVLGPTALAQPDSPAASEFLQTLKLVGIILDKDPQAIIEDRQTQNTFFLHSGEDIKGAKIEAIHKGKVSLNYGGQIVELAQ